MDAPELIIPNWHVALVHGPLALIVAGALIELFSFLWPRSTFRLAGQWMILLGCLASIPAALAGVYAMSDVVRDSLPADQQDLPWREMIALSPIGAATPVWEPMARHAWLNMIATILFAIVALAGLASRDVRRAAVRLPLMVLLLTGLAAVVIGAWYGGEMVYRHQVGIVAPEESPVEEPATQPASPVVLAGLVSVPATSATTAAATTTADQAPAALDDAEQAEQETAQATPVALMTGLMFMLPPMQVHIVLAGAAMAAGLAAMGLSFRASSIAVERYYRRETQPLARMAGAFGARPLSPIDPYDIEPPIADGPPMSRLQEGPVGRFFVLGSFLALLGAAVGVVVFLLAQEATWPFDWRGMWQQNILDPDQLEITRRFAHIVAGGAIVVVPLLLAVAAKGMPRQRWLILLLSLLLVLAMVGQVWLGILLTWDQAVGPVAGFQ